MPSFNYKKIKISKFPFRCRVGKISLIRTGLLVVGEIDFFEPFHSQFEHFHVV